MSCEYKRECPFFRAYQYCVKQIGEECPFEFVDEDKKEVESKARGLYIYVDHLGGVYVSSHNKSEDELYCETCGDSDWELGYAETRKEAKRVFVRDCPGIIRHYGAKYVREFINEHWEE